MAIHEHDNGHKKAPFRAAHEFGNQEEKLQHLDKSELLAQRRQIIG
jgi:hypothetical protein